VDLLDTAKRQLDVNREAARASISRASLLLWVEINKDSSVILLAICAAHCRAGRSRRLSD